MSHRTVSDRFIGVDAGGSRTTAVVVDATGAELARADSGPSGFQDGGPEVAAAFIRALLAELPGSADSPVRRLVCAMAGGGRRGPAKELERLLGDVAVVTDADAALHAAFGVGPGILVIAGTGSIAVGRHPDGRTGRAGGSLPPGGDPGSGEWLARQAVQRVTSMEHGPLRDAILAATGLPDTAQLTEWERSASRAAVAMSARGVGEAAAVGDPTAAGLVQRAGEELADLVLEVEARLAPWTSAPRVALAGGLVEPGRPVRSSVTTALERRAPGVDVLPDRVDGALGAALLAMRGGFVEED